MLSKQELREISNQINSPAYIFSGSEFKKRASETADILGPDVHLCYSIKANPFLLEILPSEFSAVEVCSPGELNICMKLGVKPEMIIYSGLNKGCEDIGKALDYGAGILTAESLLHLEMINDAASERGIVAKVLARASANSQFGIDRHELPNILAAHEKYPSIEFVGIHFFTGTQKRKAKEIIKELDFLARYITDIRETSGLGLPRIEYGTGLPAYMFIAKETSSLEDAISAELELLKEVSPYLTQLAQKAEVTVEMGRFFAASCGHYLSKVVDTKTNDGVNYAIIDGGSHQVRYYGQMQGMQVPFMDLIKKESSDNNEVSDWTICGSLCTTADVLARNANFDNQALGIGDTLVFHQAGAYSLYECMSLFLSRDLPSIYLYNGSKITLCRDRIESDLLNMSK